MSVKRAGRERRRFTRIMNRIRVNCIGGNVFFSDFSRDFCIGGMCVEGIYSLSPGSHVNVQFSLPEDSRTINAKARVIWAKESGRDTSVLMGLEFLNIESSYEEYIRKYLLRNRFAGKNPSPGENAE